MRRDEHLRAYPYEKPAHNERCKAQNLSLSRGPDSRNRGQQARGYRGCADARPCDGVIDDVTATSSQAPSQCELKVFRIDKCIRCQELRLERVVRRWRVHFLR